MLAFLGVLLIAGPTWAADPADKCEAAKLKEAGQYHYCRLKAEWKYVKEGDAIKYADVSAKCDEKYSEKWREIEKFFCKALVARLGG